MKKNKVLPPAKKSKVQKVPGSTKPFKTKKINEKWNYNGFSAELNIQLTIRKEEEPITPKQISKPRMKKPRAVMQPRQPRAAMQPRQPSAAMQPRQPSAAMQPKQPRAAMQPEQPRAAMQPKRPIVKVPKDSGDASSNWKMLAQTMQTPVEDTQVYRKRVTAPVVANTQVGRKHLAASAGNRRNHVALPVVTPTPVYRERVSAVATDGIVKTLDKDGHLVLSFPEMNAHYSELTMYMALDCEMVGVGPMKESALARVSIVNEFGFCLYDKYVKPKVKVTDFRTAVSGIRPENLVNASKFEEVAREVAVMLRGRIVVGHAVHHDFKALLIQHPRYMIRDTSVFFRKLNKGRTPSLKSLAARYLKTEIQTGEHSSVEDAQAVMKLYILHRNQWENSLKILQREYYLRSRVPKVMPVDYIKDEPNQI